MDKKTKEREKLILSLSGFVHQTVLRYKKPTDNDWYDVLQVAWIGAIKAVDSWDSSKGALTTHAHYQMWAEIRDYIRKNTGMFNLLNSGAYRKIQFNQNKISLHSTLKEKQEFAKELSVEISEIETWLAHQWREDWEIEDNIYYTDKHEEIELLNNIAIKDDINEYILLKTAEGYTATSIAKDLKLSKQAVTLRLRNFRQEYHHNEQ